MVPQPTVGTVSVPTVAVSRPDGGRALLAGFFGSDPVLLLAAVGGGASVVESAATVDGDGVSDDDRSRIIVAMADARYTVPDPDPASCLFFIVGSL